jgi:hypothetical protein
MGTSMLFHVTATHTAEHCAAYDLDAQKKVIEAWGNMDKLGKEVGVRVKYWALDAPAHTVFILLEAEDTKGMSKFLLSSPMRQTFDVRPVLSSKDMTQIAGKIGPEAS